MKTVSRSEVCWLTAEQTDFVFMKMNLYIYFPAVFKTCELLKFCGILIILKNKEQQVCVTELRYIES